MLESQIFEKELLNWYQKNKRDLPWRHTQNPYLIWLSEVILQQTRVKQGMPYYLKFVEAYPTVQDLANADEQEVLRHWQGLGYYSRARNMHHTAKQIVQDLEGKFPISYQELLKLKGVGKYTAAAIASFAYNESVPVVDGNVYRVLARLFGIEDDIASTKGQKIFAEQASELVSTNSAGEYNQAIMEFGATHCTPQKPNCMFCPFSTACVANQEGKQSVLPVKLKKAKARNRFFHYIVFEYEDQFLLNKRTGKEIWQGLYDFINIESKKKLEEEDVLNEISKLVETQSFLLKDVSKNYKHILSHQRLNVDFYHISLNKMYNRIGGNSVQFFTKMQIEELPKPILIQKYLEEKFSE